MTNVLDVNKNEPIIIPEQRIGTEGARQRFLVNVVSNYGLVIGQTLVNLWLTPFLIAQLGIAGFGIIPLASSIIGYMAIITNSLNDAICRFLAIDLDAGDHLTANKTFNSALFGVAGLILLMIPVAILLSVFFPTLFNVVPGWETDAKWLVVAVSLSFFVTVLAGVFALSTFVHSQFLLSNIVNFLGLVTKIGFIFIMFYFFTNRLWYAGGGALLSAFVTLLGSIWLWRKLTPELNIDVKKFDFSRLLDLGDMGWWTLVNTLGTMILSNVGLIIINIFFGAAMTGGYASVIQLALLMEYLVFAADTAIRPVILLKYAQEDFLGVKRVTSQAIKILGWALALPVGLMCGFARPLLSLWLGSSYAYLDILLIITVCHLSLNLSMKPLLRVQNAHNKVRWPGIATIITSVAFLALAVVFAKGSSLGVAGVALASTIAWTARNAIYLPIYTARIMNLRWWAFFPDFITSTVGTLLVWVAAIAITRFYIPNGWISLGVSAAIVSLVYIVVVWFLGMKRTERQLAISLVPFKFFKQGGK